MYLKYKGINIKDVGYQFTIIILIIILLCKYSSYRFDCFEFDYFRTQIFETTCF